MAFATEAFTGSSGVELSAHNSSFVRHSGSATGRTAVLNGSGYVRINSLSGDAVYYNSTAPDSADYSVFADVVPFGQPSAKGSCGVVGRVSPSVKTWYQAQHDYDTGWRLFKCVSGTFTQLGTTQAQTLTNGQTYRLELRMSGTSIKLFVDGVERVSANDSAITAAGYAGIQLNVPSSGVVSDSAGKFIDSWEAVNEAAADTTPPTLTSPTGTATGTTTASGTVSTDEATGSLFYLASTNASEDPAVVIAASSQAVSATGSQSVSFTGLTASTTYYAHYLHRDAAGYDSAVATSAGFTTPAAGDTTPPDLTGSITISALTTTSYTASWPAGSDNVAVTGYEYRIAGVAWVDRGNNLSVNITGRTPGATETFEVRAYDAAGYRSTPALSTSVTLNSATATVTVTEPLKNNTGTLLASRSGITASVLSASTLASVHTATGLTTNASGLLAAISNASITTGQQYHVAIKLADGGVGITGPITAS